MKKPLIITVLTILVLGGVVGLMYLNKSIDIFTPKDNNSNQTNWSNSKVLTVGDTVDTWPVIVSDAQGIKFTFIDAVTREIIPDEEVSVVVDNGAHSDLTILETQTDQNGMTYINFLQWPTFSYGHIVLANWNCDGKITSYPSDKNLYFTEETEELLIECVQNK